MRPLCSALIRVLFLAAAAMLCFAPPFGVAAASQNKHNKHRLLNYNYPTVNLTTVRITSRSYRDFIAELRQHLRSNDGEKIHGIPLTRRHTSVTNQSRFVLTELSSNRAAAAAGQSVTLALDVTDASVVGYRAGNHSVFLRSDRPDAAADAAATEHLFNDTTERTTLAFAGSYDALTGASGEGMEREQVELGTGALEEAIAAMHRYASAEPSSRWFQTPQLVRAFFVTIQMVSEAARFRYIEHDLSLRILYRWNTPPDPSITALEDSWRRLSDAVRSAGEGGVFRSPVQLQRRNGTRFSVDNVSVFVAMLGLLSNANANSSSSSSLLIRSVVTPPTTATMTAAAMETAVQIVGAGGMCVDVKDGRYNNGNPIILWPCRSTDNANQIWTFRSDRTVRSRGKCMAAYANRPGSYVMIYDCDPRSEAFTWQVRDDGTIVSGRGVLALTARAAAAGTELTVERIGSTVGQAWRPTNDTTAGPPALVAPIVGVFGLCLQAGNGGDDGVLLLQPCALGRPDQQWALCADGTVRPHLRRSSCLTAPAAASGVRVVATVNVSRCDLNSAVQRWEFTNDGTVVTEKDRLVLEAPGYSSPFLSQIIVNNGYTGRPNQMWQALILL